MEETKKNHNKPQLFKEGNPGGPGRPKETEEKKIVKKAIKELVKEYKQGLADALPKIKPVLIKEAMMGNIPAIKEIHDRVMDKAAQPINGGQDEQGNPIPLLANVFNNNGPSQNTEPRKEN